MPPSPTPLATFCGQCSCGCPQLWADPDAEPAKRIIVTDDFGQRIQMSTEQLADLIGQAKAGHLDAAARAG